jgi:hypothetical protein
MQLLNKIQVLVCVVSLYRTRNFRKRQSKRATPFTTRHKITSHPCLVGMELLLVHWPFVKDSFIYRAIYIPIAVLLLRLFIRPKFHKDNATLTRILTNLYPSLNITRLIKSRKRRCGRNAWNWLSLREETIWNWGVHRSVKLIVQEDVWVRTELRWLRYGSSSGLSRHTPNAMSDIRHGRSNLVHSLHDIT